MINWETILSSFDDKPTLMQWLKIVEKALQNAALESVTAKTAPNNAVAFEFKFADGSTVTSTAANLEAKGISGIEEVSDEIVGNQTLTTLRAHYTDGTTDEFPVYAENGSKLYIHTVRLSTLDDTTETTVKIISPIANSFTFDYLKDNYNNMLVLPRLLTKITETETEMTLVAQITGMLTGNNLKVSAWNLTKNTIANIENLAKVTRDIVSELK